LALHQHAWIASPTVSGSYAVLDFLAQYLAIDQGELNKVLSVALALVCNCLCL